MTGKKGSPHRRIGTHLRPDTSDEWPKQCSGCKRYTWPRDRMVNTPVPRPDWAKDRGDMIASLVDGTCARCYTPSEKRDGSAPQYTMSADGKLLPPKAVEKYVPRKHLRVRHPMTPDRLEMMKAGLRNYVLDRRARGVPPEGIPAEDWARGNGGLYHYEVP